MNIIGLHGFLGRPSDFSSLNLGLGIECFPDYFRSAELGPHLSWSDWAENFWKVYSSSAPLRLFGYSLGGRLALNAFSLFPERVESLTLISSGVWPLPPFDRPARLKMDFLWAEKFSKLPWTQLMKEWNAQAVFGGTQHEPKRLEADYDRKQLEQAMLSWSPVKMPDYTSVLAQHAHKITFVCGELDKKYLQKSQEMLQQKLFKEVKVIPQSGHRILFDQPLALSAVLKQSLGIG